MEPDVLDTHVVCKMGSYMQIRRWLKGHHPHRGQILWGWSGKETLEEISVIKPKYICTILDNEK